MVFCKFSDVGDRKNCGGGLRDFKKKKKNRTCFLIVDSPVMLKIGIFPVATSFFEGVEVGDVEESTADGSPECEGFCVCRCAGITPPKYYSCYYVVIINQCTHVIITNMQSHRPKLLCDSSSCALVTAAP